MNTTMITDAETIEHFTAVFSEHILIDDLTRRMTQGEVESMARLFRALGELAIANRWLSSHAEGDERGDAHNRRPSEPYIVPVDPMDDLQCDSCQ